MTNEVKFPYVTVSLSSIDGNAFVIIGAVKKQLRQVGATADELAAFQREATSGDYDHLIQTVMVWVETS